jgi:hypothetical protein
MHSKVATVNTIELSVLGCSVDLRADDPELLVTARTHFPHYVAPTNVVRRMRIDVRKAGERFEVWVEGRSALLSLGSSWPRFTDLIQLLIVRERQDLRFVHGSCVDFGEEAAVFVGASTCGKTTLGAALKNAGFGLVADDVTPLDMANGTAVPFRTKPAVRPFVADLLESGRAARDSHDVTAGYAEHACVPVKALFFLAPQESRSSRSKSMEKALKEWSAMYELCIGCKPKPNPSGSTLLIQRDEREFACKPELSTCRPSDALRLLFKHMHPPHPPFKTLLPMAARFLNGAASRVLKPGYVQETVDMVAGTMRSDLYA